MIKRRLLTSMALLILPASLGHSQSLRELDLRMQFLEQRLEDVERAIRDERRNKEALGQETDRQTQHKNQLQSLRACAEFRKNETAQRRFKECNENKPAPGSADEALCTLLQLDAMGCDSDRSRKGSPNAPNSR